MPNSQREQVLYEIAMSIGNSLDLKRMSQEVLGVLLKKLSASMAIILKAQKDQPVTKEQAVHSIPRRIKNYDHILKLLNKHPKHVAIERSESGSYHYIFELKDFGYLVIVRESELEELIFRSLAPIIEKLSSSLHACLLYEELQVSLEDAQQAERAKSQFLANMSHEIRTPINGINGFLEILAQSELTQKQHQHVNIIRSSAQTLLAVINDILDFSKIEAGELLIDPVPCDLQAELSYLFETFNKLSDNKGLSFSGEVDSRLPQYVIQDKLRIKQILTNLVNNAIKFTHEGGIKITLELLDQHDDEIMVRFSIEDSGIGIEQEKLETIFEAFKQSNNSTSRQYGGTGLGLSITKELVELLGGELRVQSVYGEGSCFSFTMPCRIDAQIEASGVEKKEERYDFAKAKVLVAEDHTINQLLMKELLGSVGIQPDIANNGMEAYEYYREKEYDLVLMDHHMPQLNGIESMKKIRAYETEQHKEATPIIVLTANALVGVKEEYLAEGFDGYLSKPIEVDRLQETLKRYLPNSF
jgi:signal transduction histidine kinase/CheY-like chemotaxis protein